MHLHFAQLLEGKYMVSLSLKRYSGEMPHLFTFVASHFTGRFKKEAS